MALRSHEVRLRGLGRLLLDLLKLEPWLELWEQRTDRVVFALARDVISHAIKVA